MDSSKSSKKDENNIEINSLCEDELLEVFKHVPMTYILKLDDIHLGYLVTKKEMKVKILALAKNYLSTSQTFVSFLNRLSYANVKKFLDEETLLLIIHHPHKNTLIHALVSSSNSNVINYLKDSLIVDYFISNFDHYRFVLDEIDLSFIVYVFKQIYEKDPSKMKYILQLNAEQQLAIIEDIGYYAFLRLSKKEELFTQLDERVITYLVTFEPFTSYFVSQSCQDIMDLIERGVSLPHDLSYNKKFLDKVVSITSPSVYRFFQNSILEVSYNNHRRRKRSFLENCIAYYKANGITYHEDELFKQMPLDNFLPLSFYTSNFDVTPMEKLREKHYDEQIKKILLCANLLPEYYYLYQNPKLSYLENIDASQKLLDWFDSDQSKENLYVILYQMTTEKLCDILIDRYYKDIPHNFLINLENMLDILVNIDLDELNLPKDKMISLKKRLSRYQTIIQFPSLSRLEQINFYQSFDKEYDYVSEFYEDYNLAKDYAYKNMNEVVFQPETNSHLLTRKIDDVPIYELKGETFYAYIHVTNVRRDEYTDNCQLWINRKERYLSDPLSYSSTFGVSLSLTNDKKLRTFRPVQEYVTFGYNYLDPKRISHIYHADSYSNYYQNGPGMNKINEICLPQTLIDKTRIYSEILYQEASDVLLDQDVAANYTNLQPNYLLCYDTITDKDIEIAKKMHLAILLVHTAYYPIDDDDYNDYNTENEYVISLKDSIKVNTYK